LQKFVEKETAMKENPTFSRSFLSYVSQHSCAH